MARRLLVRRTNRKRQWSSIQTWASNLKMVDQWVGHRPFLEVAPDDWATVIDDHLIPDDGPAFWGIPNNKEAATYTHLTGDDMATVARSNPGIDQYGYRLPTMDAGAPDLHAKLLSLEAEVARLKGSLRPMP